MPVTDWKSPAECGLTYDEWLAPENMYASDNTRAAASMYEYDDTQDEEDYWYFDFTADDIPVGATIDDIEISLEGNSGSATVGCIMACYLMQNGVRQSDLVLYGLQFLGTKDSTKTGYFTLLQTYTQADVTDSEFGVYLQCVELAGPAVFNGDHVQLRIYWHLEIDATESIALYDTTTRNLAVSTDEDIAIADTITRAIAISATAEHLALTERKIITKSGVCPTGEPGTEKDISRSACREKSMGSASCTEKEITT